jgi:hypothetical protein
MEGAAQRAAPSAIYGLRLAEIHVAVVGLDQADAANRFGSSGGGSLQRLLSSSWFDPDDPRSKIGEAAISKSLLSRTYLQHDGREF